jgi:hypothetical protein
MALSVAFLNYVGEVVYFNAFLCPNRYVNFWFIYIF